MFVAISWLPLLISLFSPQLFWAAPFLQLGYRFKLHFNFLKSASPAVILLKPFNSINYYIL